MSGHGTPLCGATTVVPSYDTTVICELPHGHDGPHHGHIDAGPTLAEAGSYHYMGPTSYDWRAE